MRSLEQVLLIHPEGNTFNNPTLKCVIDLLLKHKVEVEIRYFSGGAKTPPSITGINFLPYGRIFNKLKNISFNIYCSRRLSWLTVWVERMFIYRQYDLIIGVDREGLIAAGLLSQMTGTPFEFFSFEILFESETSLAFKSLERDAAKLVSRWFIQDELRAHHLQLETGLDSATRMLLPLASSGAGLSSIERLRDRLGIPLDKKVAIAIGSFASWSMTQDIVSSVAKWPEDWVLIIHERYGRTAEEFTAIGCEPSGLVNGKLYLSNFSSTMVDDMGFILAGVSVGLACYKPDYKGAYTGKNLKYLGLASGKISTFMRYGVPILMNEIGLYADLAREHSFGLVIKESNDISALLPLFKNDSWGINAFNFYEAHLDFANYEGLVWRALIRE